MIQDYSGRQRHYLAWGACLMISEPRDEYIIFEHYPDIRRMRLASRMWIERGSIQRCYPSKYCLILVSRLLQTTEGLELVFNSILCRAKGAVRNGTGRRGWGLYRICRRSRRRLQMVL